MSVRVFAPAKVNLTLQVGRLRADGLHPLQSVVVFADAGDWVEAAPTHDLSLRVEGPFAPGLDAGEGNLVLRAARALAQAAGAGAPGAALTLTKNLPVASGIGGGSSDAAATLHALNALWGLGLSEPRLIEIARGLGADVPVCVAARSALMSGAGDRFTRFDVPELAAVLVNPGAPLETGAVYRQFDAMGLGADLAPAPDQPWPDAAAACAHAAAIGNDLEAPARALLPELAEVAALLAGSPGVCYAALSGSGATMFALTEDSAAAGTLAQRLRRQRQSWWAADVRLGGTARGVRFG